MKNESNKINDKMDNLLPLTFKIKTKKIVNTKTHDYKIGLS